MDNVLAMKVLPIIMLKVCAYQVNIPLASYLMYGILSDKKYSI